MKKQNEYYTITVETTGGTIHKTTKGLHKNCIHRMVIASQSEIAKIRHLLPKKVKVSGAVILMGDTARQAFTLLA